MTENDAPPPDGYQMTATINAWRFLPRLDDTGKHFIVEGATMPDRIRRAFCTSGFGEGVGGVTELAVEGIADPQAPQGVRPVLKVRNRHGSVVCERGDAITWIDRGEQVEKIGDEPPAEHLIAIPAKFFDANYRLIPRDTAGTPTSEAGILAWPATVTDGAKMPSDIARMVQEVIGAALGVDAADNPPDDDDEEDEEDLPLDPDQRFSVLACIGVTYRGPDDESCVAQVFVDETARELHVIAPDLYPADTARIRLDPDQVPHTRHRRCLVAMVREVITKMRDEMNEADERESLFGPAPD